MIVKILDTDGSSWWMYDNLEKVHFEIFSHKIVTSTVAADSDDGVTEVEIESRLSDDPKDIVKIHPEVTIINLDTINKANQNPVPTNYVLVRDIQDREKMIVFNTLGFILNDQGKTLEKIPSVSEKFSIMEKCCTPDGKD